MCGNGLTVRFFILYFFLQLSNLQGQMSSKSGGDDLASPIALHLNVIDLPVRQTS